MDQLDAGLSYLYGFSVDQINRSTVAITVRAKQNGASH